MPGSLSVDRIGRTVAALAAVALAGGVSGCGATPEPRPPEPCDVQVVTLDIYAADDVNPNENGNPRPVVVRLYQLRNDQRMLNATYDAILLEDKAALQDDLAKVDEVQVFPNDLVQVKFERLKDASVLSGVALFHSPKGQSWKSFYEFPLPPGEARCAGRGSEAGKPEADPHTAFFLESTRIDNGSHLDASMFPDASPIRRVNLPKKSAAPEPPPPEAKASGASR